VQPLRPDLAGEQFAVQRDKPAPATQPQRQHLLAHHLPARHVVEMAGHAGHLLAVANFDGVVQHQNLRTGRGLQSPDGLQRHGLVKPPPVQVLAVHQVVQGILFGIAKRMQGLPRKQGDGTRLQPDPQHQRKRKPWDRRPRALAETGPLQQRIHAHLFPKVGKQVVDQKAAVPEQVDGQGWKRGKFCVTMHAEVSLCGVIGSFQDNQYYTTQETLFPLYIIFLWHHFKLSRISKLQFLN
jgi:hypothetical protein